MKIFSRGRPRQNSFTRISCRDSLMVEMLECVPDTTSTPTLDQILSTRQQHGLNFLNAIHVFYHGAILTVGPNPDEFYIKTHSSDGSDGLSAFDELKMLDHLRHAKRHLLAMRKVCYVPGKEVLSLRVTRY